MGVELKKANVEFEKAWKEKPKGAIEKIVAYYWFLAGWNAKFADDGD